MHKEAQIEKIMRPRMLCVSEELNNFRRRFVLTWLFFARHDEFRMLLREPNVGTGGTGDEDRCGLVCSVVLDVKKGAWRWRFVLYTGPRNSPLWLLLSPPTWSGARATGGWEARRDATPSHSRGRPTLTSGSTRQR